MYSTLEQIVVYTWAYGYPGPSLDAPLYSLPLWLTKHTLYLGPEQWAREVVLLYVAQAMVVNKRLGKQSASQGTGRGDEDEIECSGS